MNDTPSTAHAALNPSTYFTTWQETLIASGLIVLAALAGFVAQFIVMKTLSRLLRRNEGPSVTGNFLTSLAWPLRIAAPLVAVLFAANYVALTAGAAGALRHAVSLGLIFAVTLAAARVVRQAVQVYLRRYDITTADNLHSRRIHTQISVVTRLVSAIIWVVGISTAIMTFPTIRQLGSSILASAGLAGLVVGLAAQKVIGNFLAGVQIALTEPINIDDVVIVEKEFGRIEDITSTYVVVKTWDERRLIVPFARFIEQPFENWTRRSAQILGSAMFHVDYNAPLGRIRAEFERVVNASPHWDRRVAVMHVTDCTERTVQLRALVSAPNASAAWDLRCELREKLIEFLQRHHPEALPRERIVLGGSRDLLSPSSN